MERLSGSMLRMMQPFFHGVVFPVGRLRVTMPFGATETKWYSKERPHRGVDVAPFPGSAGEPVLAPVSGVVTFVGEHEFAGKEVVLVCAVPYPFGATGLDGFVYTIAEGERFWFRLTHHSVVVVRVNDVVHAGQQIAMVGSSGAYTTGPHVHLELRKGEQYETAVVLNPLDFFAAALPGFRGRVEMPW